MPMTDLATAFDELLSGFTGERRLYELQGEGELGELLVEAWSLREGLSEPWQLELSAVSLRADLDIDAMLGRKITLLTTLADGSKHPRSGIVMAASTDEADGGFARYRLSVQPWLALLAHTRRSQVWQDRSLVQIIESVFGQYRQHAAWTWAADTTAHLQASPFANADDVRSYTVQYRETDLAFITRLLAEEGLIYRFQPDESAPLGHRLILLADTPAESSTPADRTSASALGGQGIRYHRASAREEQDAIQAFGGQRSLQSASTTVLAWDYKAKRAVATSVPTAAAFAGKNAPRLEAYDPSSPYTYPSSAQAERAARLQQEALEARHKLWLGRSTVRSFTAGTRFQLTDSTLDVLGELRQALGASGEDQNSDQAPNQNTDPTAAKTFLLTHITHAGINNLPKDLSQAIAARLHEGGADLLEPWVDDAVRAQVKATGYANSFHAIRAHVPWRALQTDETGARLNPKPTALGLQTATVVGPSGQTQASGADEIHTDALGRIRIQHHFQSQAGAGQGTSTSTSTASTWVRVLQRYAGAGMGLQFIPRIGQEVLIDYLEGDIDRPLVIGALYNGKGEAGTPATPGGKAAEADTRAFGQSTDHRPSAQGNLSGNLSGGHSPAWHGASAQDLSAGGQRNAAALSGYKTKEFGAEGFNQLVFDDSDQQLRTQLATTQHASQLNLGHLIHQADNHRGSFRGLGFELRTDAYGAIRTKSGLLISSYGTSPSEPAGDNAAGIALMGQLKTLGETFSGGAQTHQTVQLAGQLGATKANQSSLSTQEAPYKALHTVLKGMVSDTSPDQANEDASNKSTSTAEGKVPHSTDPVIAISAKAGLALVAGQDIQLAAGEGITLASGQDTHWAVGGASRIHTGQAIGMLGGAIKPGEEAAGKGLTLIAGKGDIEVQAQADKMQIAAKNDVSIQSQSAHIDWAAAKKITLSTAGGATITIEGGNITVQCPGTINILAATKSFVGPERLRYPTDPFTKHDFCLLCFLRAAKAAAAVVPT